MVFVVVDGAHGQDGGGRDSGGVSVEFRSVAGGFAAPVFLTEPDDGTGRLFVVDQIGEIRIVDDGEVQGDPFLDVSGRIVDLEAGYDERGLLGLAFHPDYADNGRLFVYYSAPLRDGGPEGWNHTSHLSEFRVSDDDPGRVDPDSERILMRIDQPYANHNGGHIGFGRDGYLRIPLGDGGNGGDIDAEGDDLGRPEEGNAQTRSTLLGSILRIDVDSGDPYGIPSDNPFAGGDGGREEIWAYGFRNPYGLSFDRETGDAYAADAGQALWEEISRVQPGGNHGWHIREGTHCFNPDDFTDPPADCPDTGANGEPLVPPVIEYPRGPETGSVIIPGVMYRGEAMPSLRGHVVFGDYSRVRFRPDGILYAAEPAEDGETNGAPRILDVRTPDTDTPSGDLGRFALGVMQDLDGELYLLTSRAGGPDGDTGEVLAFQSTSSEDGEAGTEQWPWIVALAGVAVVLAIGLVGFLRRRGTTPPAQSP